MPTDTRKCSPVPRGRQGRGPQRFEGCKGDVAWDRRSERPTRPSCPARGRTTPCRHSGTTPRGRTPATSSDVRSRSPSAATSRTFQAVASTPTVRGGSPSRAAGRSAYSACPYRPDIDSRNRERWTDRRRNPGRGDQKDPGHFGQPREQGPYLTCPMRWRGATRPDVRTALRAALFGGGTGAPGQCRNVYVRRREPGGRREQFALCELQPRRTLRRRSAVPSRRPPRTGARPIARRGSAWPAPRRAATARTRRASSVQAPGPSAGGGRWQVAHGAEPALRLPFVHHECRAGYRIATTDEPCPNSPWLAVIPTRAPATCRSPAVPRNCHVSSQT